MKNLNTWTRLPSRWIEEGGLHAFRWVAGEGADNLAALMTLTVIANHIDDDSGIARLTYSELSEKTSLSRAKVSAGLDVLGDRDLIERTPEGRSSYRLQNYDKEQGWAQLPARGLYHNGVVAAFSEFRLRRPAELDAMKLYYLFAARRARQTNIAIISYDGIEQYTGIIRGHIRRALTVLAVNGLVHVDRMNRDPGEFGVAHGYRLAHLNPRMHAGTTGRGEVFDPSELNY